MKKRQIAIWMAASLMMSTCASNMAAAEMILPDEPADVAAEEDLLMDDGEELADPVEDVPEQGDFIDDRDDFEEDSIEPEGELPDELLIIDDDTEDEEPEKPAEPEVPATPEDSDDADLEDDSEVDPEPARPRKAPGDGLIVDSNEEEYETGKGWAISAANWPDSALRSYIADTLDTDLDGYLSEEENQSTKTLFCTNLGIKSAEGIKIFTNLKTAYLEENELTELDLSGMKSLEAIFCRENQITSLNVSGCGSMTLISAMDNKLKTLDVSDNSMLEYLMVPSNELTQIVTGNHPKIKHIDVETNRLTDLNTYHMPELQEVLANENPYLRHVDFRLNPKLENLLLYDTAMTHVDMCRPLTFKYSPDHVDWYPISMTSISYWGLPSDFDRSYDPIKYSVAFTESDQSVMKKIHENSGSKMVMYYPYEASAWDDAALATVPREDVELVPWNPITMEVQPFELDTKELQLKEGETYQARVYATPATPAPDYEWISEDPSVASVDADGTIHAKGVGVTCIIVTGQPNEIHTRQSEMMVTVADQSAGTGQIAIDEHAFPDPIFRKYVMDHLDTNKDGSLSEEEQGAVTEIDCKDLAIKTFRGIQKFRNLENLNITNTEITSFPYLGSLTKLKVLRCQGVTMPSLILRYNTELVELYCDNDLYEGKQIGKVDVSGCPKLERLHCRGNGLYGITVAYNPKLIELDCGMNNIVSLDLRQNPELLFLTASLNPNLSTVLVAENNLLSQVMLSGCAFTELDTSKMENLRILAVDSNRGLNALDLRGNHGMEELWFDATPIEKIVMCQPTHFRTEPLNRSAYPSALKEVYYTGEAFKWAPCEPIFDETDQLYLNEHYEETGEYLRVYYPYDNKTWTGDKLFKFNYVYWIPWDPSTGKIMADGYAINADNWPDAAFRKYIAENIDADKNGFISNAEIRETTELNCDDLGIKSLKGVSIFNALETIHLETNELTDLDVTGLKKLQRLYAGYNHLTSVNVADCPELYGLALWNNRLTSVDISKNPQLDWINVSNNAKITNLDVCKNRSLRFIYARACDLEELDTTNLRLLEEVDVNENTRLRVVDFKCNPYLTYLGAAHTAITSMDMCRPVPFKQEHHMIESPDHLQTIFYWGVGSDYESESNDPIDYKVAFTEDDRYAMECIHRTIGQKLVIYYPYKVAAWNTAARATVSTKDVELIPWDAMIGQVQKFAFAEKEVKLIPGYSKKLAPPVANPATPKPRYVWSSSNTKVATVSQDGTVRALASGTTTIKVTGLAYEPIKRAATMTVRVVKGGRLTYVLNGGKNTSKNPPGYSSADGVTFYKASRTGYLFAGWYTDANMTKRVYGIVAGASGNKTLYAKWIPIDYKLIFNWNTGTSGRMSSLKLTYDKAIKLPANTFVKKYYTFTGWNTKKDGTGTAYKNRQWVKNLAAKNGASVTFYAQWKRTPYKIVFNKNSSAATGTMGKQTAYQGKRVTLVKNSFTRKGYTFIGWAKTPTGPVVYRNQMIVTYASMNPKGRTSVTLYAKWKKK